MDVFVANIMGNDYPVYLGDFWNQQSTLLLPNLKCKGLRVILSGDAADVLMVGHVLPVSHLARLHARLSVSLSHDPEASRAAAKPC